MFRNLDKMGVGGCAVGSWYLNLKFVFKSLRALNRRLLFVSVSI